MKDLDAVADALAEVLGDDPEDVRTEPPNRLSLRIDQVERLLDRIREDRIQEGDHA